MNHKQQELLEIVRTIFQYAGFRRMTHINELMQSKIYLEILKLVFEANRLKALKKCEDLSDDQCLDEIVAFLNKEHRSNLQIRGTDITDGDYKKIKQLLETLKILADEQIRGINYSQRSVSHSLGNSSGENNDMGIQAEALSEIHRVQQMYRDMAKTDNRTGRTDDLEDKKVKYQFYLKNMTKQVNRQNAKLQKQQKQKKNKNKQRSHRVKSKRQIAAQIKALNDDQISSKLKLRETKYRYLSKIAKVVSVLQRQRINDQKKIQRQVQKKWRQQNHLMAQSMENFHQTKMTMLKQQQQQIKKNANIFMKTRQQLGRTLEKKIKEDFQTEKQKTRNRNKQYYQKMIFQLQDDKIEEKLIKLYKKL